MNAASLSSLALARELLALETAAAKKSAGRSGNGGAASSPAHPAVQVCEKLRIVLTIFAGAAGFRSLLTRALTLARSQEPSLAGVRILEDGSLAGFETLQTENDNGSTKKRRKAAGAATADEVLVAQLLDLLIIFIGEPLSLQLARSAWPDAPLGALGSRTKDTV